jgi:protein kinase A
MDLFKRIVLVQYEMPPTVHFVAADLIQKLLCRNVPDRLGNLKRGHFDIHDHKWFGMNGISYKKLLKREMIAPWIPKLKDPFDVSNFDEYNYSRSERHLPLSSAQQALFAGF